MTNTACSKDSLTTTSDTKDSFVCLEVVKCPTNFFLDKNMTELKENVLEQVSKILTENSDQEISNKLTQVQDEVNKMTFNKMNYFKLKELKNGLN